jgi:DNA-binding Xre family transcriptional regulator
MNGNAPEAYSRLRTVLAKRNLTVFQLHRKLDSAGLPVNIKSLYRLTSDEPLQKVDLRIAGAVCRACDVGIGDLITFQKPRAQLHRLDPRMQARLDELMDKNNEGQLNAREQKEFAALAEEAHRVSLENARMLVAERRRSISAKDRIAARRSPVKLREPITA